MGRHGHHESLPHEKRDLEKEKIRSLNDAWKGYLKTWDKWNSQRSTYSGGEGGGYTPQGGLTQGHPKWTPNCNGQHADGHGQVMAYGHKTQSLMKNGGQQKCLDKALCICVLPFTSIFCVFIVFNSNYFSHIKIYFKPI